MPDRAPPGTFPAHLVLLAVQFFFGSFPVAGKFAFAAGFQPGGIAFWRIVVGSVFLLGLARRLYPTRWRLPKSVLAKACLLSLFGVSLNQMMFVIALQGSTATKGGLLVTLIPVMTYALAVLFRRERASVLRFAGVLIAFSGAFFLIVDKGQGLATGDLFFIANAFCYSLYLVLVRPLVHEYPPLVIAAWMFVLAVPLLPALFLFGPVWPPNGGTSAFLPIAWIILFPTIGAYLGNAWALSRVASSTTAVYIFIQPAIAALLSYSLLDEVLGIREGVMAILAVIGILLVTRK